MTPILKKELREQMFAFVIMPFFSDFCNSLDKVLTRNVLIKLLKVTLRFSLLLYMS